jgi:hypothetical protein
LVLLPCSSLAVTWSSSSCGQLLLELAPVPHPPAPVLQEIPSTKILGWPLQATKSGRGNGLMDWLSWCSCGVMAGVDMEMIQWRNIHGSRVCNSCREWIVCEREAGSVEVIHSTPRSAGCFYIMGWLLCRWQQRYM